MDDSDEVFKSTAVEIAALISERSGSGSMSLALLEQVVIELVSIVSPNILSDKAVMATLSDRAIQALTIIRMEELGIV